MNYRYQVNFEKVFVSGILKGRRYTNDYLRFCDWQSANKFVESCNGTDIVNQCAGSGAYVKEYPILSAIE
jgi:hypothetical protein